MFWLETPCRRLHRAVRQAPSYCPGHGRESVLALLFVGNEVEGTDDRIVVVQGANDALAGVLQARLAGTSSPGKKDGATPRARPQVRETSRTHTVAGCTRRSLALTPAGRYR